MMLIIFNVSSNDIHVTICRFWDYVNNKYSNNWNPSSLNTFILSYIQFTSRGGIGELFSEIKKIGCRNWWTGEHLIIGNMRPILSNNFCMYKKKKNVKKVYQDYSQVMQKLSIMDLWWCCFFFKCVELFLCFIA